MDQDSEVLTKERLNSEYRKLNEKYYGPSVITDEYIEENGQEYLISSMTFTYIKNIQLDLVVEYILPKALLKVDNKSLQNILIS